MRKPGWAFLAVLAIALSSNAEVTTTGQKGLIRCYSAKTLERGRLVVNLNGEFTNDKSYVISPVDAEMALASSNIGLSFGIASFLDLSFGLPVYGDVLNTAAENWQLKYVAPGDANVGLKLQYPPYEHPRVFDMAFLGLASLPTGAKAKGVFPRHAYYLPKQDLDSTSLHSFYTAEKPAMDLEMLWTLDFGSIEWDHQENTQLQIHLNFGARFNTNTQLEHAFLLNSAIQYTPVPFLTLFTEFTGETRLSKFSKGFNVGDDPLRLTPGISINTPVGMTIKLGVDKSLSRTDTILNWVQAGNHHYSTEILPDWNLVAFLQWGGFLISRDRDGDQIKDSEDRCPNEAEDLDGFEDGDGCPDPDNDKDGIADVKDRCPGQAEDMDGFEDDDGCPDPDNDRDGIPDAKDRCPAQAEDMDGFEDFDGCPDVDNDKDGIPDATDKCINDAEDKDNFEDQDGCPDADNDKDGMPDLRDKCPDQPETMNGVQDDDGCPDTVAKPVKQIEKRVQLRGVNFKTGTTDLTYESFSILDNVAEQLAGAPQVRIEIRGYTDNIGQRSANLRLSQLRAESVKNYLVRKGVDSDRLIPIGYGPDNPIAPNRTAAGRAENRRIELYRLN